MVDRDRATGFEDLPDALVADLLTAADSLGEQVWRQIGALVAMRPELRRKARDSGLILARADLDVVREPSVAAVDGSYQIHRLTSLDLCAAAAVAVEGSIREERRKWDHPHHRLWLDAAAHSAETTNALRGVMVGMELDLARSAPHDLVMLDGAFSPLVIYLNQSRGARTGASPALRSHLDDRWEVTTQSLLWALGGEKVVAVPKYATRNELARALDEDPERTDGKTLATALLEAGEYTRPLPVYDSDPKYHLAGLEETASSELDRGMRDIQVVYFRPYNWLPAIRVEIPGAQVRRAARLALVLEGVARQLITPAVFEPYPLFLADRMVKSLGVGVQVLEQAISQRVLTDAGDAEETLLFLRQHRTEGGRGY